MQLDKDEFIYGLPIQTEHGLVRFLQYIEFTKYKIEAYLFNQNVLHIYHMYEKDMDSDVDKIELVNSIKESTLREIVVTLPQFRHAYLTIFSLIFDTNNYSEDELMGVIEDIMFDEDKFTYYRTLIQDMNMLIEDKVSEDKTTQYYIELARKAKSENGQSNSILNIVTSLVLSSSYTFEQIAYLTVIQVNALFFKLNQFKNFEMTTLFATVSNDVKVESWAEVPDLFKKESLTIDGKEFNKKYGGLTK